MNNFSKTKEQIKGLLIGFVLVVGMSYVSAWTGPSVAPTGGNTAEPINVGSLAQSKLGSLAVTVLSADAVTVNTATGITSPKYCISTSCVSSWSNGGSFITPTDMGLSKTTFPTSFYGGKSNWYLSGISGTSVYYNTLAATPTTCYMAFNFLTGALVASASTGCAGDAVFSYASLPALCAAKTCHYQP
jgi:hypothetical protein